VRRQVERGREVVLMGVIEMEERREGERESQRLIGRRMWRDGWMKEGGGGGGVIIHLRGGSF
jgi:hypothetical protein